MKLCQYRQGPQGRERQGVGLVLDDTGASVLSAAALLRRLPGGPPPRLAADLMTLLAAPGEPLVALGQALARWQRDGLPDAAGRRLKPLVKPTLLAPLTFPRKLFALAGNYVDHITEGGQALAQADLETPRFFTKPASTCIIGPGAGIPILPHNRALDWEGELAVVIGRGGRGIRADQALDHVLGYTIMNDVSERKLSIWPRGESRERDKFFDWLNGKWGDGFAPLGPWIVTRDELPDPQALEIVTRVNETVKQRCATSQMIFPVARLIAFISTFVTLEPGDVISTGTVAGVGHATGHYLQAGDQVSVTIPGIGTLANAVVKAGP